MNIVVCIYKGDEYYANLVWREVWALSSQEELIEYIDVESGHEWVNGLKMDRIEELFFLYQDVTILLEKPGIQSEDIWTANRIEVLSPINYVDFSTYMKFKQIGIRSYIVNVPFEIKCVYGSFCSMMLTEQWMREAKDFTRRKLEDNLKRITDLSFEEWNTMVLDKIPVRRQEKQIGSGNKSRTIFLIGPCTVSGCSPSEKYMTEILNSLLEKFNTSYKIIKIDGRVFPNKIMEYDICQNDIVVFLGAGLSYKDFDLTEDYEQYDGIKNLCTNSTLHISRAGSELIANAIMRDIIIPNNDIVYSTDDKKVLHTAEKGQLQFDTEYEIKLYLKRLQIPRTMRLGNNGAIVMNANPYTIGHRKLVEYAAGQVDWLFLFVVEEDVSFFSFKERFEMVVQGTKDIKNVTVIASGNFIISNKTFNDYFTKESDNRKKVDASVDILIFARYMVPYFNIKKRFVGEEPIDKITEQYNEQMKTILPNYGCELVKIPRFSSENTIVSASIVRKNLQERNIDYLQNLLPITSFKYICENLELLIKRNVGMKNHNGQKAFLTDRMLRIVEIVDFIKTEKKIIIYGIGNETLQILKLLENEDKEKIVFVDKRAEISDIIFMGKKVIPPDRLAELYSDYHIIILSSRYCREIYFKCMDLGFAKEQIKYNPYNLYCGFMLEV